MRVSILIVGIGMFASITTTPGVARDIAPIEPPPRQTLGQVIDRRQPAIIPKFLSQRSIPAGLAEREWAIRNTYPSFGFFGFGGWGFGRGYFGGSYASGWGGGYGAIGGGFGGGFGGNWSPGASFEGASLP